MATRFNGTSGGYSYDLTSAYHVLYATATSFKVNVTSTVSGSATTYTAWVLKNGTATAVYYGGQNYTGTYAQYFFTAAMTTFLIENEYTTPQVLSALTSPLFSHVTGQETLMLGPTSVSATNYAANTIPLNINECGFTGQFTRFSVQTGVVSGEPLTLLTGLNLAGSFSSNGSTENVNLTFHITSLTKSA